MTFYPKAAGWTQLEIAHRLTEDSIALYDMEFLDRKVTITFDDIYPSLAQQFVDQYHALNDLDMAEEDIMAERYNLSLNFIQKIIS
jgi:uncharacterized protein YdgA (DUF945 family)